MQVLAQSPCASSSPPDDPDTGEHAEGGAAASDLGDPYPASPPARWPDAGAEGMPLSEQALLLASVLDALEAEGRFMVRISMAGSYCVRAQ